MMDILTPIIEKAFQDISLGRMFESIIVFAIVWNRLTPHLKKIEARLGGLETTLHDGFNLGESRFQKIENRLDNLEFKMPREAIHEGSL